MGKRPSALVARPMTGGGGAAHWRDRRVLITGATGLVGSWVLRRLLDLHADPVCLVRDQVPRSRAVAEGLLAQSVVVRGCIEDHEQLERCINEYEIRTVLHLAAQTIVGIANANPLSTFEANVKGTWNVLEACRRTQGVESIVVASSDKAYGTAARLPYDETFPLNGSHPYDVSKSCGDLIASAYFRTYGTPVAITRCGNFYGGGDLNWNRLVPGTIRSLLRGERPVLRSDGTPRRDYLYVENAAAAYLQLAERVATDPSVHGEAFNFSNEAPKRALDMVHEIGRACGRSDLMPLIQNGGLNEIPDQFLNATKAREILGWVPMLTLEDGMRRTVAWYSEFFDNLAQVDS